MIDEIKGWAYGKLAEAVGNSATGWVADNASAFPIIAVVSGCVYCFVGMFSKRLASVCALGTFVYGVFVLL